MQRISSLTLNKIMIYIQVIMAIKYRICYLIFNLHFRHKHLCDVNRLFSTLVINDKFYEI